MLWLARMFRDGIAVKKDEQMALEWYNKSKNNVQFSKFELLALLSAQNRRFDNIPEGLKIDTHKKERLYVYNFDSRCMNQLVNLFPFTHYEIVGYSYMDKLQFGYNESCQDYDKILIANIEESSTIREELVLGGLESEKIITIHPYMGELEFDGEAIVCDFGEERPTKPICVIVPGESNGLVWFYNMLGKFNGPAPSECDYFVDMQNHFSMMLEYVNIGRYNAWDYFFQQISHLSLEEIYRKRGVMITKRNRTLRDKRQFDIRPVLSDSISRKIEFEYKKIKHKKVLGVICRGTDYVSMQPYNHAVPLDEYELIEIVEERMKCLGFTGVYLSTEDQRAYDAFNKHFGSKLNAVDQIRFNREQTFNSKILDKKVINSFGKLIQGERYLIATLLLLKCDATILSSSSAATLILDQGTKVNELHNKGVWGQFGENPLIVCSRNKNHISMLNAIQNNECGFCVDEDGMLHTGRSKIIVLENVDVYLDANRDYVSSLNCVGPKMPTVFLVLSSGDKETVIQLNHGCIFKLPFDVSSGSIKIETESVEDITLGIQIEEGCTPTKYAPPIFSETRICIRDDHDNLFSSTDVDCIDFAKGIFIVKGARHKFSPRELERYNNIICYDNGFITYHKGFTRIFKKESGPSAVLTIGSSPRINPKYIVGRPKQLRRFSHTVEMADYLLKGCTGDVEEALCIYSFHASNDNFIAKYKLARMYCDGNYIGKDEDKAIELMRDYARFKICWVTNEFIDLLCKRGYNEDLMEAFNLASGFSTKGDGGAMGRLGRMYRDGKGVEKDLDKAIEWMRKAAEKNPSWNNEFMDVLWKRGTPDDLMELKGDAEKGAAEGNAFALQWLARMYRDGKGVEKDLDKAIDMMRKTAEKIQGWSRNELVDMLWKRGTPEDFEEMKSVAETAAGEGDIGAMGRLGRMYRDGKGVEKDLDKAIEWMRKAAEKNPIWNREIQELIE